MRRPAMPKPRVGTRKRDKDMIPAALMQKAMQEMLPIVTQLVSQNEFTRVESALLAWSSRLSIRLEPYGCELVLPPLPSDQGA